MSSASSSHPLETGADREGQQPSRVDSAISVSAIVAASTGAITTSSFVAAIFFW
jgi:hypothetical protein